MNGSLAATLIVLAFFAFQAWYAWLNSRARKLHGDLKRAREELSAKEPER